MLCYQKNKTLVHDRLDSHGNLLLGEYFVSHMLQYIKVYLIYNILLITYSFNGAKGLIKFML